MGIGSERKFMINIAAVVEHLGPSQKSFYMINEFNKTLSALNLCASVFTVKPAIPVIPTMFSCRSVAFMSGYHHNLFATTIGEANTLLKGNNRAAKFLYLWDLSWVDSPMNYNEVCSVLRDDRLKIIARSEDHAEMIDNFCNKKTVGVVDNWNLDSLVEMVNEHGNK